MSILTKDQRNQLEKVVLKAREIAEAGATKALHTLGVGDSDAPKSSTLEQRKLRVALRAQSKQLGDGEDKVKKGYYSLKHLTEKIGYDQWHRMLFARFLAENNLLISPQHGIAVSLEDCQELAPELGFRDEWEVAANFASRMLPQIFRSDDPAGKIQLAPEDLNELESSLRELPVDIFRAADSLGWVYQFWQTQHKKEVNISGKKIGADELAPVTQLFTEDYMVQFLLHNTLGAWWAGKNMPTEGIIATSEEEARANVALPGINWEYLRFIRDEQTGTWKPAAGVFPYWPRTSKELRVLDPCMGSGHFLVAELPMLVAMREAEDGLTKTGAVIAVLGENIFGLEIDARCTQIAAFNLALSAWKIAGYQPLPSLNLACSGLGIFSSRESWLKLANGNASFRWGMDRLYDLFKDAPVLGSLIDPQKLPGSGFNISFHELQPLLNQALSREDNQRDDDSREMGVMAEGIVKATEILTDNFSLIATNVPYLLKGKQNEILQSFCSAHYPVAHHDLATSFIERCFSLCSSGGSIALVTPQNWLFLRSYTAFRKHIIVEKTIDNITRIGSGATATASWDVLRALPILTNKNPTLEYLVTGTETEAADEDQRAIDIQLGSISSATNRDLLQNPYHRLMLSSVTHGTKLESHAKSLQGLSTGDNMRYQFQFWEVIQFDGVWAFQQGPVSSTRSYGGLEKVILWESGKGALVKSSNSAIRGLQALEHRGVAVTQMRELPVTLFLGSFFDTNIAIILPIDENKLLAIWAYCSSDEFPQNVRKIDTKLGVTNATLTQVPFDLEFWSIVAHDKFPNGLPKPAAQYPTQWIFNGHPKGSEQPLHVGVARVLGYRWPRQTGSKFLDCPSLGNDGLEKFADDDGIVCIHTTKNEASASERLRTLLADSYGNEWTNDKQKELLEQAGYGSKTLEDWLRNGFFEQHCQIFQQRPFIWQIWDGLKNGFSVLVNYHTLDKANLEKLTYTYLGDWITRQKIVVEASEEGSDARLTAAQELQRKLQLILEGEQPYDIFVRWKPPEKQPIGWEPDLNDGVRLNIRPFITAGVLRKNPKINWNKDRGTDVTSAPWYSRFKGERINDFHLTLEAKKKARNK